MARHSRLKDHHAEQRMFGRRVVAASFVIMLVLGALFARLFYLQVVKHDYFSELSQGNRIRIEPIPPPRGLILDRNGEPLALNRPAYQLEVTREQTPDLDDTLAGLVELGLLPAEDVTRTKRTIMARRVFEAVPVRLQLSDWNSRDSPCTDRIFQASKSGRASPACIRTAARGVHALGYVGAISEQDQERIDVASTSGTTLIGKLGLERKYEDVLHGETGYQQLLVNAQGRRVDRVGLKAPDLHAQGADCGQRPDPHARPSPADGGRGRARHDRAAIVAIDPSNGDILAFVSTPTFDPNGFARGLTVPEYRALADNPDKPLIDRALRGVYPPGSTIKPFVALAALEYGVVEPEDTATAAASGSSRARATSTATGRRRPRHRGHAQGDRAVVRHLFLRRHRPDRHRSPARFPAPVRASDKTGIDMRANARGSCRRGPGKRRHSRRRNCRSGSPAKR